jgi:hypothetical protein
MVTADDELPEFVLDTLPGEPAIMRPAPSGRHTQRARRVPAAAESDPMIYVPVANNTHPHGVNAP